ncbi:hypothetical protein HUJ04_012908 [Dendroctonus ponderosae]|uniref:THAP-type domain-containing protein n=1 Tax=Dendroctonus ponderosae TaxID=77166 RepID=A0AAR5PN43_DENPD|nr:hypothetical protein HUJ04_012908 [Dendroctonus ponderosae]
MAGCSAIGCTNSSEKGFLMRRFPKDLQRRRQWGIKMKRANWVPTDSSKICEIHFEAAMWEKTRVDGSRKLKRNAVPTIFPFTKPKKIRKAPTLRTTPTREADQHTTRATSPCFSTNIQELNKIESESECDDLLEFTPVTVEEELAPSSSEESVVRKTAPQNFALNITCPSEAIKKENTGCTDTDIEQPQDIARTSEEKPNKEEDDEFDCFGKSVACQLKKLPESAALKSIAYIQSYLVQQRLAQLSSK